MNGIRIQTVIPSDLYDKIVKVQNKNELENISQTLRFIIREYIKECD